MQVFGFFLRVLKKLFQNVSHTSCKIKGFFVKFLSTPATGQKAPNIKIDQRPACQGANVHSEDEKGNS